jgi:hypothetical protein
MKALIKFYNIETRKMIFEKSVSELFTAPFCFYFVTRGKQKERLSACPVSLFDVNE